MYSIDTANKKYLAKLENKKQKACKHVMILKKLNDNYTCQKCKSYFNVLKIEKP